MQLPDSAQTAQERHTGFIVVRLNPARFGRLISEVDDLRALARQAGATELSRVLDMYSTLAMSRLISGISTDKILELERHGTDLGAARQSLSWYWRIDAKAINERQPLVDLLNQLAEVDIAYQQPRGSDPAAVNPSDDVHFSKQTYLKAAPDGIDAEWAWTQHPHGSGALVGFVDLERGWFFGHEDLPPVVTFPGVSQEVEPGSQPHGTAVLGIVAGLDNNKGIIGIAPTPSWVSVTSHIRGGVADQVSDAILQVIIHMTPGDVLLVEWQEVFTNQPAELIPDIWAAIRTATDNGIVVVECAGNGNDSLDAFPEIDRNNPATDSGAIMVGACHYDLDSIGQGHDRWVVAPNGGSNYGTRVDCHAFGERIATAGPARNASGVLDPGTGPNNAYRKDFGATSGAGAIVAGAAVVLQGMHKAVKGVPLTPRQMRAVFSTQGTPQGIGKPGHIGVMPDLKKAATALSLVASTPAPAPPSNLRIK